MTSVDSGVETGNDSNDSSIVQHENLASNQISNVRSTVATGASIYYDRDIHQHESEITCNRKMKTYSTLQRKQRHCTWMDMKDPMERKMRVAAATNHTAAILRLLRLGISPNNRNKQGRTPLHLASDGGYTEIVRLLLEHGADPNQRDCTGNTPLHLAARTCRISVVTLLLQAGTDVMSLDQNGYSPLQLAQMNLRMIPTCEASDLVKVKEDVHNIICMLLVHLQKQKDGGEKVETLSTIYSRLSLSNTSDQVQDDVKDILANLDGLNITS